MSRKQGDKPIEILLVEDNLGDARLAAEAFKEGDKKSPNRLHVVEDGVEAMEFLQRENGYAEVPKPNIILLDLNLPRKDGREVLAEVKSDDELKQIPVIVMTTSQAEEDIVKSYELQANAYITKPIDFDNFVSSVESFESFWLETVELPPTEDE